MLNLTYPQLQWLNITAQPILTCHVTTLHFHITFIWLHTQYLHPMLWPYMLTATMTSHDAPTIPELCWHDWPPRHNNLPYTTSDCPDLPNNDVNIPLLTYCSMTWLALMCAPTCSNVAGDEKHKKFTLSKGAHNERSQPWSEGKTEETANKYSSGRCKCYAHLHSWLV